MTSYSKKFNNLGFHVSRDNNIFEKFDNYIKLGFKTFQIYATSPKQLLGSVNVTFFEKLKKYISDNKINIYIHAPYTINLSNKYKRNGYWNTSLIRELNIASDIGAKGVIIHTGKSLNQNKDVATMNMIANISYCIEISKPKCKLIIETPAGQGTELCSTIEEFSKFWKLIPKQIKSKLGICIDTCHIYSAGYDLTNKSIVKKYLMFFINNIGLKYLKFIHLNDSKVKLNAHVDRHSVLGKGYINNNLKYIFLQFYKYNIPTIIETPGILKNDIKILKSWLK
jgi:apurinic endonuclease APN1